MQRPLVLMLAHDGQPLSQQLADFVQQLASQEGSSFALLRPKEQLRAQQQGQQERTAAAHQDGELSDDDAAVDVIAEAVRQCAAEAEPRKILLLSGYPSSLAELQRLVDRGMLDGVLTVVCDDNGAEVRSSDGPKSTSGADRLLSTSTPEQIEEERRFIANIPPERLPVVASWTQLVRDQVKHGGNWLSVSVDEVNAREWDEGLGCMADVPADRFQEIFLHRLHELAEMRHEYMQCVLHVTEYTVGAGEYSAGQPNFTEQQNRESTQQEQEQEEEEEAHNHHQEHDDGQENYMVSPTDDAQISTALHADLIAAYNSLLEKVPSIACTESIVVCAIVAAVTHSDELIPARLSARAGSMLEWNNSWGVHEIPCTVEDGDAISARCTRISVSVAAAARAASLTNADSGARMASITPHNWIEYTKAARSQAQSPRLFGHSAMPVYDAMDDKERGLMETQLMAFAKAPSALIHRCRIIRMFDELIEKLASYESLSARSMYNWSALNYPFHRQLSASAFQQILAAEMRKRPVLIREYDSVTDQLLVLLMWRPVSGRLSRTKRLLRDFVRPRASYEEFLAHRQGNLTPRTVTAAQSVLRADDDPAMLNKAIETVQLFPSDHSIITVTGGGVSPLLTIDYLNYTIGLRKDMVVENGNDAAKAIDERCCLTCQADDDMCFVVGLSDVGIPYVTCTADDQRLRFSLDGTICMNFQALDPQELLLCPAARRELERRINTNGEVLQLLRDGTQRCLKPAGEMVAYLPATKREGDGPANDPWFDKIHIARASGTDSTWTADTGQWSHSSTLEDVRREKDIPSSATRDIRSNGMSLVRFLDGATAATFPDGTSIRCAPDFAKTRMVFVECPGLPAVEMNTNVSALAPRETRSCFRCVTPDGTKIQNVAKYVGVSRTERKLVVERRDGTRIEVGEDGNVSLSFNSRFDVWDGSEMSSEEMSTTYEFDLATRKFWMEDSESNRFELQLADALNPRVDLAGSVPGVRAKPLISDPIPPRFFVMKRDGCAVELLDRVRVPIVRHDKAGLPAAVCSPRECTVHEGQRTPSSAPTQLPAFFRVVTASRHAFQDGFQAHDWETRPVPAAVRLERITLAANWPPIYLRQVVLQQEPLGAADVQRIADAVLEWRRWKTSRVAQGTRVLEDHRSIEEQELEAELTKQLRQLYKNLRANARKEKRLAQEAMMQKASEEMARQDAALETESIVSDTSSMMGDEPVMDEEELELLDAFQGATRSDDAHISFDGLRQALVQALGRGVSRRELQAVVIDLFGGVTDVVDRQYDMEEFRSIYNFFSTEKIEEPSADSAVADGRSDLNTRTAPAGVMQSADVGGANYTPGRAITHTGVPRDGWTKYDETRLPSRPAVGSGRNAVLAGGAQS